MILLFMLTIGNYFNFASTEENKTNDNEVVEEEQKSSAAATIRPSKRSEIKTLEEFIPSEEVSSDKPVAFPTDI